MASISTCTAVSLALLMSAVPVFADEHAVHPVTGQTLASDQSFVYRVANESPSFDPGLVEDVDGLTIVRDLFEGLMNQDANGNLIPGVATGYAVSENLRVYTFNLRDNAKWSNGDPVTARDFVYAWQRAASPELASPYSWYLALMSIENGDAVIAGDLPLDALGVAAVDDLTFEVTLTQPLPHFAQMVVHGTLFPIHRATVETHGAEWTLAENIVSNGAYKLQEHVPQDKLTRVRNELYWNDANTIIEEVTALVIPDENTALTRYLAGELDHTDAPAGQFPRLQSEFPDQAVSVPEACTYYYTVNLTDTSNPALRDPNVRQALSLAIDRDVIVNDVLAGGQKPAYTFTHWAIAGFDAPENQATQMDQTARAEQAASLMAEAGYGPENPLALNLIYNTAESHEYVAIAVSQMWEETLGVRTELTNQDWPAFLATRDAQDFEIARAGWCADYNEASSFLDQMASDASQNFGGFQNDRVDTLLAQARLLSDPQAAYAEIEEIIASELPIIPIYHYATADMFAADLGGFPYSNIQQNWYSRDLYKIAE